MVTSAAECLYVTYGNSGQLAHAESWPHDVSFLSTSCCNSACVLV